MDEQERMLRDAEPGDVRSLEVAVDRQPRIGARYTLMTFPRRSADEPLKTGLMPGENGDWEVVRVEPVEEDPKVVRIHIMVR